MRAIAVGVVLGLVLAVMIGWAWLLGCPLIDRDPIEAF